MSAPTPQLARAVIASLGGAGQPPDVGIETINVGNESILSVLEEEYLGPIAATGRGSSFKLVQAYYGGGKTHFLLCVRQRAWSRGMCSALVNLSPDECPFDDTRRIYTSVARELCWPPADTSVAPTRGIEHTLAAAYDEKVLQLGETGVGEWIETQVRTVPVDAPSWRAGMVSFFRARHAGDAGGEELSAAWLRGDELSPAEMKTLGVRESITRENGMRMLRSLCQGLQGIGSPGLLIAFDEVDRALSLPPKRRRLIADNLRQLIDACGREQLPGLLCLYAVPPEFMTNVITEYPALQQRLKGPSALSERSPQSPLIDLENLDLPTEALLQQIGARILELFRIGYAEQWDTPLQAANIRALAKEVRDTAFEVAHRRAFVKSAVEMLHGQRVGAHPITSDEVGALVGRAASVVPADDDEGEF